MYTHTQITVLAERHFPLQRPRCAHGCAPIKHAITTAYKFLFMVKIIQRYSPGWPSPTDSDVKRNVSPNSSGSMWPFC